ncbi:MAG: hypothetical protein QJR09_00095 [Micrococcus sp.]|nr:hypothetical protein [Micrococcus sp.]
MIVNGKPKSYSGQGNFWGNILVWAVCFVLFLGCLYAMGWWEFETVWVPGVIAMVLAVLTFIIPQGILGRGDTVDHEAIHAENPVARRGH